MACAECSGVQPEKACDKENDDDYADDVENVHGVLRWSHARFQMKARRSNRKRPGLQVSSMLGFFCGSTEQYKMRNQIGTGSRLDEVANADLGWLGINRHRGDFVPIRIQDRNAPRRIDCWFVE
jgi:hypothetical protein